MFGFSKKDKANNLKPRELTKEEQERILAKTEQILKETKRDAPRAPSTDPVTAESSGRVTKDTPIGEAARSSPHAAEILMSYGLHCIGCGMTAFETIEQGCAGHGMDDGTVRALVEELNEAAEDFNREMEESV